MDIEVVGRHALLFDDDGAAIFVNSKDALVEWNSLSIDRYDVRHLLSSPPASFRRMRPASSPPPDLHLEAELDLERYADLPSPSDEPPSEVETDLEPTTTNISGFHAVPFAYGNSADRTEQKDDVTGLENSGFRPPFAVPENLVQNLPPTEKIHQIIARTAVFVNEHGGQSEIVLRVKQGDNPTFGFLMPHHQLHPYFRYLVDHPEILKEKENSSENQAGGGAGGALSLLGSVYGDEDAEIDDGHESKEEDLKGKPTTRNVATQNLLNVLDNESQSDEVASKLRYPSKEKAVLARKSGATNIIKPKSSGVGRKVSGDVADVSKVSGLPSTSEGEPCLVEPPSEMKRLVDRIVEIILKNGQGFEALLVEQDKSHGRFPFLLPTNQYHSYYLDVLGRAQKSKVSGKSSSLQMDASSLERQRSSSIDLPFNNDRKEKFKMVIGKSKKDAVEQPLKDTLQPNGVSVDVDAAAAILQAATRGIKKPNLDLFSKTSSDGPAHGSAEGSSHGAFQLQTSTQKQSGSGSHSVGVPAANEIAKTAAIVAASEADSSEAGLTREQKLKAERLKRAKMFAAMIKSRGAPPLGKDVLHGVSSSDVEVRDKEGKEREGSSIPEDGRTSEKITKSDQEYSDNDDKVSKKKRQYRSRTQEQKDEEEVEKEEREKDDDEKDERHSRKKHRSHHSRHRRDRSKDQYKHRKRHSSSKDEESKSRTRHKHERATEEEDDIDDHHGHSKHHHHDSASEDEYRSHSHKRRDSHRDKHGDERKSSKHKKKSHSSGEREEEEEEINDDLRIEGSSLTVGDTAHREPSGEVGLVLNQVRSTSQQTTDVPDDLRAKIRAMLLATL